MEIILDGKIEGDFEGFDGEKVFTFTNGQKWQQARHRYMYRYRFSPSAKIWRDGGRFLIEVDGIDEMIEVRKI